MKTRKAEHDLTWNGAAIDIWENEGGASAQARTGLNRPDATAGMLPPVRPEGWKTLNG